MTIIEKAEQLKDEGKFAMRSCWECNQLHNHLKKVGGLFTCIECGRWYMNGDYLTNDNHCNSEYKDIDPIKTTVIKIQL